MDSDFDQATAYQRLAALERLEMLQRLHAQAKQAGRAAMLKTIEDLMAMDRRALARYLDDKPA
jgi:hypothetical protein